MSERRNISWGGYQKMTKPISLMAVGVAALLATCITASAATVVNSGGSLGTELSFFNKGLIDIDGDGIDDIEFDDFDPSPSSGFFVASSSFGLVGNIGAAPPTGSAWVRSTSTIVTGDGVGRNEIVSSARGALLGSSDNWSKVHLSSGDGWLQWMILASDQVTPLNFVREDVGENLSAAQASALVSPVPLPAALPMLLVALGGLSLAARRRKSD